VLNASVLKIPSENWQDRMPPRLRWLPAAYLYFLILQSANRVIPCKHYLSYWQCFRESAKYFCSTALYDFTQLHAFDKRIIFHLCSFYCHKHALWTVPFLWTPHVIFLSVLL